MDRARSQALTGAAVGAAIALGYYGIRTWMLHQFPISTPSGWADRDVLFTIPRFIAAVNAMFACWFLYGWEGSGWHARWTKTGAIAILSGGLLVLLDTLVAPEWFVLTPMQIFKCTLTTVVVAIHEEAVWRGLLYGSLRRLIGPLGAALVSSIGFAFWHWGVQDMRYWYFLASFGLSACAALEAGTGLVWVAAVHFAVDALALAVFTMTGGDLLIPIGFVQAFCAAASAYALYYLSISKKISAK